MLDHHSSQDTPPDNYMVWAILSTVFCCMPLGIVSLIKASKVEQLWREGHHQAARETAEEAKKWAIYSAISIGAIIIITIIVAMFFIIMGGAYQL